MEDKNGFLVHIACMTYNHESFIKDTLDGFVMQETSFPFVAVIIDDASTDKTGEILKQYMADHFLFNDSLVSRNVEKDYGRLLFAQHSENHNCFFAVILLKENHYRRKKSKNAYYQEWSNTKYKAICEGDDYWTDPSKLRKQVDYMENNPDCSLCAHLASWEVQGVLQPRGCQNEDSFDLSMEENIRNGGLYLATASFLYRSELDQEWPEWRKTARIGDFPLQLLCGLKGRVHVLSETMCVYRFCHEGSWSNIHQSLDVEYAENEIKWMKMLDENTNNTYSSIISSFLYKYYRYLYLHRQIGFREYWKNARKAEYFTPKRVLKDFVKVALGLV